MSPIILRDPRAEHLYDALWLHFMGREKESYEILDELARKIEESTEEKQHG